MSHKTGEVNLRQEDIGLWLPVDRVPFHMQEKIKEALRFLEFQNGYKILFAYESGSRAWGFHSPDSDYDVRFVYIRPKKDYISVAERRDVCESFKGHAKGTKFEDDLLDIVGWDFRKALGLMRKSNPQLLEWLHGPLPYYIRDPAFNEYLKTVAEHVTNMWPIYMHYRGMAVGNFREYLQGDTVRYKKYLYVIRPLLAAQYVAETMKIPPVEFDTLWSNTAGIHSDEFSASVERLLAHKKRSQETDTMPKDPVLNKWIEDQLANPRTEFPIQPKLNSSDTTLLLDHAFHAALEHWGN